MARLKYGLLGWPVAHSASPAMQMAGFQALGITADYCLLPVAPEQLAEKVAELRQQGYSGWNVTVPHKEAILPLLTWLDDDARLAASVNTVLVQGDSLRGYSTDGYGLARAIEEELQIPLSGSRQLYLGTGGAAGAAAVYAARHGAAAIYLVNRTLARAEELAVRLQAAAPLCQVHCLPLADIVGVEKFMQQCQVLIQCTSLGLHVGDACPFPPERVPSALPVFDMIYGATEFKRRLQVLGHPVVSGWSMLLYQGCRSLELWSGQKAPVEVMRQALARVSLL